MPPGEKYHNTEVWNPICLLDECGYFHGAAYFDTRHEAEKYVQIFKDRISERRNKKLEARERHAHSAKKSTDFILKVFREEKIPNDDLFYSNNE
jgi:hypothetical protein